MSILKGNAPKYGVKKTQADENSPLRGKKIIFLGSSVTFGSRALGESFVDYLAKKDGVIAMKEAVPGTTLVDNGKNSYIARLKKTDVSFRADAFVCQLSTNDATLGLPVGQIGGAENTESFDTSTVAGAIEYIITYAKKTWNCPVIFYTGTRYDSENYARLVALLHEIAEKHGIGIIDLWNDPMNGIPERTYRLYMADGIHPTRVGYREWWLPAFEKYLTRALCG